MTRATRFQKIKTIIKISLAVCIVGILIVLGIFVRPERTFENSHMKKWLSLTEHQKNLTLNQIVKKSDNQQLLLDCVDKIASLKDSDEMVIRDAVAICYNGIKINSNTFQNETDEK